MKIKRIKSCDEQLIKEIFSKVGFKYQQANPKFFEKDDNYLIVSYEDNIPTGFLFAYLLESVHYLSPKMFLYSIDVFEEYQHQGIGTQLIENLKLEAKSRGCDEIFVLTNEANNNAKGLYQKTGGFRENEDDVMYVYNL